MAVRSKKPVAKAEPEVDQPDYSPYRDKAPTDLQERFAQWIVDKVDPVAHDEDGEDLELDLASFNEGVRLGVALRMEFQASPENQQVLAEKRSAREEAEEAPKPARKRAAAKAKVEEEPEEEEPEEDAEEPEEAEEPAPKARRTATKASTAGKTATPAKPARRATRSRAAAPKAKAEVGSDAPF